MDSEEITVSSSDREYKKKRVEELGSTLAKIRARVKANRGSAAKNEDEVQSSGGSKNSEDFERTALTKKLEEDRVRFSKHQSEKAKIKEAMDQIMIDREEQKKVEKQLQEAIAKVTAPAPELPPLIKQRIIDLETTVDNLKERLYEKDKVLSSKSQALTVLHNQLMQRSQEHADRAMAITQEISALKEDFGKREENWKKEMQRLKGREEELEQRLSEKEAHTAEVESLQSELALIRQNLSEAANKNQDVSNKLETLNKINLKLKAQLKAVKQERDKLKEIQESSEDVEPLKNRIALLEEEKGNLQLQLVDFDDVKESLESATLKANAVEDEMIKLKESMIKLIEEKEALQKGLDEANQGTSQQFQVIEQLKLALKEVEEQKISAEMRSIEMEEKLETLQSNMNKQLEQLLGEISFLKNQFDEKNSMISLLENQLSLKDQEISDIKGNNFPAEVETETRLKEIESYNSELVEKIRELQLKCEGHEQAVIQLNENLSERNDTINQLKLNYDQTVTSLNEIKNVKYNLECEIERLKALENSLRKEKKSNEGAIVNAEHKEDVNLAQKFKKLAANYKIRTKLCQELEEKLKNLNDVLEEKDKMIMQLSEHEVELKAEIDSIKCKELGFNQELESVKTKNSKLLAIIDDLTPKLEALEAERSAALINVDKMNKAFEELKGWKEGDSKLLKEHVTSVNSMANHVLLLEDNLGNLQSIVNEKNSVIGELETERKKLVEDMKNSEVELERLRALYQQESVKNQHVLTNLQGLESEMLVSREEMNQIAEQLDAVTKNYNMCVGNLQERENYIEALEQDIIGMKSKMYNLESGIEDKHRMLQERGNQLSAKLEEAEILRHSYDKYQVEVEKKFKLMEESEKSLKNNVIELQNEIQSLKNTNYKLRKEQEAYEVEKSKMLSEISNLNDIRNSYNATLDRIEVLNEELKQVMDDFEAKNQELMKLDEERTDLFNKLTDLEEAYSDVKNNLAESEEVTNKLKGELDEKNNLLAELKNEIFNLQISIEELKTKQNNGSQLSITTDAAPMQKEHPVVMFSWDQHSQHSVAKDEEDGLKFELEEKQKALEAAHKEIGNLQLTINSISNQKDNELDEKNNLLAELKNEISNLQITIGEFKAKQSDGSQLSITTDAAPMQKEHPVVMFSWDQHSQHSVAKDEEDGLKFELEEKQKALEAAHKEIENLQLTINSILNQKDNKILPSPSSEKLDKKEQNVRVFSWDQHSQESGKDDEDGWGWIGAEAHLEQDHKHSEALQIQNLTQRVKELEEEQKCLSDKLAASKIKCAKLLKKLKETGAIHEQLKNERSVGFSDLDFALQEELRSQLDQLEIKNKELSSELSSLKLEKDNLSKRVDVLTTANEHLVEMKERQDIEVHMWQKRSSELKNELQGLQWTIEELKSEMPSHNKGDEELAEKFNALVTENDELQRVICNLKDGRPIGSPETALELNSLKDELSKLKEIRVKEKENYECETKKANEEIDAMELQLDVLTKENQDLKDKLTISASSNQDEIPSLRDQIQKLSSDNKKLEALLSNANEEINLLKTIIDEKSKVNDNVNLQLTNFKKEMDSLLEKIQSVSIDNDELKEKLKLYSEKFMSSHQESETIDDLNRQLYTTRNELTILQNKIDFVNSNNTNLQEQLKNISESAASEINKHVGHLQKHSETIKNLENELKFAQGHISDLETNIEDLISKMQISTISNNSVEKLKEVIVAVSHQLSNKIELEKEIFALKEEISKYTKNDNPQETANASLPVFKGFSVSSHDPFGSITENQQSTELGSIKINSETENLKIVVSKLEEEKRSYLNEIAGLKSQLSNLQDHLSKLNIDYTKLAEEMKFKLERSEAEIHHWREQANALNQEISNLVLRHQQEMEDLKSNEEGSKEKLIEIEENYQNSLLNKEQENINLKHSLVEKEQLIANSANELNSLQTQYGLISQQLFALENRLRDLTKENEMLQNELDNSKRSENTIIEKQKEEIQELIAKLEYISQSENIKKEESDNANYLRLQLNELSNQYKTLETSNIHFQKTISSQAEEISKLKENILVQENRRAYLESLITEKQNELEQSCQLVANQQYLNSETSNTEADKFITLIKQKDLEIEQVSKVLLDTQERLVQVQESKPNDKVLSLQSKLDKALYTLHIRDVRCDELTQEIMQLLEERDALQLRLSECLRENDILRKGNANNSSAPSPELKDKLGELHKGYKRDPVVQLEIENRHNQQMNLYTEEESKEDKDTTVDYGFFNWFFSSPTSNSSQQ